MNRKRIVFASAAVFGMLFILEYLIHGIWLRQIYFETASVWRAEAEMKSLMAFMWLGYLIFAPFFVIVYSKGYEREKPALGQGLRYGVFMGLVFSPLSALVWYAVLPIPAILAFYWFLGMMVEMITCGVVAGIIYQPRD